MNGNSDRFAREIGVFNAHRAQWIATGQEGRWIAIRGEEIVGPFDRPELAWRAAVDRFGAPGFFMRRITREDKPIVVSHLHFPSEGVES